MLGPEWRKTIEDRLISGATVDRVPLIEFPKFPIRLPGLETQLRISAVLTAFDELVEINQRRIKLLRDLARSLYREWFVRFRFPGFDSVELAESSLGGIPRAWTVGEINDVVSVLSRGISPKYADDGPWLTLNQRCIRNHQVNTDLVRRQSRDVPNTKVVRFGDVLINSTGVGTLGRVAILLEEVANLTVDSHVMIARAASSETQAWFGLHMLDREAELKSMGTGSTGQTELGRKAVGALELAVPDRTIQKAFGDRVWPLLSATAILTHQALRLSATRDMLLPRLVTGRLDIADLDLDALLSAAGAA